MISPQQYFNVPYSYYMSLSDRGAPDFEKIVIMGGLAPLKLI